jgi:hypothetical protein
VDWIDPNTWKLPAELIGYWQTILVGLAAIAAFILGIIRWGLKPLRWLWSGTKSKAPEKSILLSFVPNDQSCHWGGARLNDQPGTFVSGRWDVTNSSKSDVMILKARLGKYATRFVNVRTHHPEDERDIFGKFPVPSFGMSEVSADFTFFPAISRGHEPIISDVIFTDNFGNEHRVSTQFSYIRPDKPF